MRIECTLDFEYESEEEAEKVIKAVEVDNYEFVKVERKGTRIISKVNASTLSSLLHTLDDYLACVALAERVLRR